MGKRNGPGTKMQLMNRRVKVVRDGGGVEGEG